MSVDVSMDCVGPVFPDGREKALANPSVQELERSEWGLSDAELGVLATLMYRDDFWAVADRYVNAKDENGKYLTLAQVLDKFHEEAENGDIPEVKELPAKKLGNAMSEAEWVVFERAVRENPDLAGLRLGDVDVYRGGGNQAAAFIFTDNQGHDMPYVVFRGTHGPVEWGDNVRGVSHVDTEQQLHALEYVEFVYAKYGRCVTTAGHSKGGNKTAYTSLLSGHVCRGVVFDGQGFSQSFLRKYKDEIEGNKGKLAGYALSGDYVHSLLNGVVEEKNMHFIYSGHVERGDLGGYHSSYSLINFYNPASPRFYPEVKQDGFLADETNKFTVWAEKNVPFSKQEKLTSVVEKFFQYSDSEEDIQIVLDKVIRNDPEGVGVLIAVLTQYPDIEDLLLALGAQYAGIESKMGAGTLFTVGSSLAHSPLGQLLIKLVTGKILSFEELRLMLSEEAQFDFFLDLIKLVASCDGECEKKIRKGYDDTVRDINNPDVRPFAPGTGVVRDYSEAKEEEVIQEIRRINSLIQEHEQQAKQLLENNRRTHNPRSPLGGIPPQSQLGHNIREHQRIAAELRQSITLTEAQARKIFFEARDYDKRLAVKVQNLTSTIDSVNQQLTKVIPHA